MKLKVLKLSQEERMRVLEIVEKGRDCCVRHRAQTLLYLGHAWTAKAIAAK